MGNDPLVTIGFERELVGPNSQRRVRVTNDSLHDRMYSMPESTVINGVDLTSLKVELIHCAAQHLASMCLSIKLALHFRNSFFRLDGIGNTLNWKCAFRQNLYESKQ
jgi:hypothetical protein